jgi:hexosaminidase
MLRAGVFATCRQAWPVESLSYPLLWSGAWSPRERYTIADLQFVVEYARLRGVRVVPEFDTPGHAASVCVGYPEACPSPNCTMPLRPTGNFTFDLIQGVLSDWTTEVFPDQYLHLGGDEVRTQCDTVTKLL